TRMQGLGASPDAVRVAATMETSATALDTYVWPSEAKKFRDGLRGGVERLASGTLEQEVDKLIAGSSGVSGAFAINDALAIRVGPTDAQAAAAARAQGGMRIPGLFASTGRSTGPVQLAELARNAPEAWAAQQPRLTKRLNELLNEVYGTART